MHKTISLIVAALLSSYIHSQAPSFYLFAGAQASTASYKVNDETQDVSSKFGFHAGAGMKVPFENQLSFNPSIFYSLKGYEVKFTQYAFPPDEEAVDNNTRLHTAEIALLLQLDFSPRANHVFLKLGPTIDFQLAGKEKFSKMDGSVVDRNMKFSYGDYGRYLANIKAELGYESRSGFIVAAGFTQGLSSLNNADGGPKIFHQVFGVSLGTYLNRKLR